MNIAGVGIGNGNPCRLVAELANGHNGDLDRCLRMIDAAKEAGADFVKLQLYTPEELVALRGGGPAPEPWESQGWKMRDLYKKAMTPAKWVPEIAKHCEDVGIPWFSSVFGEFSLAILEMFDCPAYKLASLDYGRRKLWRLVKKTGKPIIQSCPKFVAPKRDAFMLYCPPGYPQKPTGLAHPMKSYGGFSYHGVDPDMPALAAAFGARLIECHFHLADEPSELEASVSLDQYLFQIMVEKITAFGEWT